MTHLGAIFDFDSEGVKGGGGIMPPSPPKNVNWSRGTEHMQQVK